MSNREMVGPAANFDPSHDHHWLIARWANDLSQLELGVLELDSKGFINDIGTGHFSLPSESSALYIDFTALPEPGTAAFLAGFALFLLPRRRRNRF